VADRVLLDVIDEHATAVEPAVANEHIENHPRSLVFVLQVRRVDENLLVVFHGQLQMLQEDDRLIARIFVEADLRNANTEGLDKKNAYLKYAKLKGTTWE
jgi:hypothetical protein